MSFSVWGKTLISAERYIERLVDGIDRMIDKCAENSFYVNSFNFVSNSTSCVCNRIIDLSARKVTLINTKILVENALSLCKEEYAVLLIKKYIDGDKAKDIIEELKMAPRSYFRRLKLALDNFCISLNKLGYDENKIYDMLKEERWILALYNSLEKSEENALSEGAINKLALS